MVTRLRVARMLVAAPIWGLECAGTGVALAGLWAKERMARLATWIETDSGPSSNAGPTSRGGSSSGGGTSC